MIHLKVKTQFYNNVPISNEDKLLHKILKSCCTSGSIGKSSLYIDRNQMPKIKHIDKYKKKNEHYNYFITRL